MEITKSTNDKSMMKYRVCASCGKDCEAPFITNNQEPFLCMNCYRERRPKY